MKVVKFRIKNYKSIIDSNDCYFSEAITILAGKNESGKTSILEALEDFHQDSSIREDAKPLNSNDTPEITVTFEVDGDTINEILEQLNLAEIKEKKLYITLVKKFKINGYSLDLNTRSELGIPNLLSKQKKLVQSLLKKIKENLKDQQVQIPELKDKRLDSFKKEISTLQDSVNKLNFEQKEDVSQKITELVEAIELHYVQENFLDSFTEIFVADHLPYFIQFSSFDDVFPDSIDITSLSSNSWAQDLQEVSTFDITKITSDNEQEQEIHERSVNIDFSEKFQSFWTQDEIKLQIKKDGDKLKFRIIENEIPYYPRQRSKGQQWYLGFYIKIVSKINDTKPNIILIDEPGLYLHAKAQKDLLKVFKKHSSIYPVVFSTHSPYLIELENLESVRLVEKRNNVEGSKILGKIHAHTTADKETLTPILTAIGLGVNDSILNIDQKNNVVVEGPADMFYLQAFKKLSSSNVNINFINGGGAPNMAFVGTILEGWGSEVLYLFDNDSGKKQGEKKLESFHVRSNLIKAVTEEEGDAIEDILSIQDFKKNVLGNEKLKYKTKNSSYVSKQKKDKVLLARLFLQKVSTEKIELDKESKQRIEKLLTTLKFKKS